MSDIVYCGACGERIEPSARFCSACGAAAPDPAPAEAPAEAPTRTATASPASPVQPRDQLGPAASDFAGVLARFLRSPGVLTATFAAAVGAGVQFAFGMLVAIVCTPTSSIIGASLGYAEDGERASVVTRGCRQMLATLLIPFNVGSYGSIRPVPALFVLVPLAAVAVVMARQARRLRELPVRERFLWGALTGIPFALLMMIPLLGSGYIAPSLGWTVVASLVWGAIAGLAGTWWAIRRDAPETLHGLLPPSARAVAASVRAVLGPLAILLAVTTVIGTGVWVVQTTRGVRGLREDRPTVGATVEHALYAVGHGIHYAELGSLTAFALPQSGQPGELAIPVTKVVKLAGVAKPADLFTDDGDPIDGTYRLFDYRRPLPIWAFLLLVVPLLAIPALMAVYGGFGLARLRDAPTPAQGVAWGALIGPAWALTMVVLSTLFASNPWLGGELFGAPKGDSVLVTFLLGGAALGALGGLLATSGARAGVPATPEPTRA